MTTISKLKVMKSNAGFYLGRSDLEDGSPYSRESEYFETAERAEELLDKNPDLWYRQADENLGLMQLYIFLKDDWKNELTLDKEMHRWEFQNGLL